MLFSFVIGPSVDGAICPLLNALAVLQVVEPVTFVAGPVSVSELTLTFGFIVLPLTLIYVAISMNQLANAV